MAENEKNWQDEYNKLQAQYTDDMNKVYTALTQNQPQQPVSEPPAWDTQDPRKLQEQVEGSLRKTVTDTLAPVVTTLAGNQFEANVGILRGDSRFPYFQKWENEIRELAKQVHHGLLANMNTLTNLYQLVISRHQAELVEEEVQKRLQAQAESEKPDDSGEVEVEEDEEEPETPAQPPSPPLPPQPQPSAARSTVAVQQSRGLRAPVKIRLTREEAYMADKLGMTPKEYAQAKELGDIAI